MMRPEGVLSKKDILQRTRLATILLWRRMAPRTTQKLWTTAAGNDQGRVGSVQVSGRSRQVSDMSDVKM